MAAEPLRVVCWRNLSTGDEGRGEPMEAEAADAWAEGLNAGPTYRGLFLHWTEPAPPQPETPDAP